MIKTCQPCPQGEKEEQGWHSWLVHGGAHLCPEMHAMAKKAKN